MFSRTIFAGFPQNAGDLKKKKKIFASNSQIFRKIQASKFFFASFLACSKTKQHCSWPWPIFNNSKIVLSSNCGQGIFEDLQCSRPKPSTRPLMPRPKTSNYVLEDSTSACTFLLLGEGHLIKTLRYSSLEPNFIYDLSLLMNILVNTQTITTKICQCLEALKCIFLRKRKGFFENCHLQPFASYVTNCCLQKFKLNHAIT